MAHFHLEPSGASSGDSSKPWWREMNRYHWFVMLVAALGWLFDCLDQQLFVLVRQPAMTELVTSPGMDAIEAKKAVDTSSDYVTAIFLIGWASGGLIFGVMGDRIGRAKTMMLTILLYSIFTGLSAASTGFWDFALYRFLTGLGVGGEFAVGVALIAEVMPDRARPFCLTLLQMLSTVGNIGAALINMRLGILEEHGLESPWRIVFLVGTLPALLALLIRWRLKEPERWQKVSHEGDVKKQLGSYRELFGQPTLRKHALFGLMLAASGVIGLWAIGFFAPDLTGSVLRPKVTANIFKEKTAVAAGNTEELAAVAAVQNLILLPDGGLRKDNPAIPTELQETKKKIDQSINGRLAYWRSITGIMQQIGACIGMFVFGVLAHRIGRKPTFAICFVAGFVSTVWVFLSLSEFWHLYFMIPIMGLCQTSVFAGYAMYFPELFPTYLRSTGTSFCYNVGRFVAATGPIAKTGLYSLFSHTEEPMRYAGATLAGVYLIALIALPFLPETRGKPLPE